MFSLGRADGEDAQSEEDNSPVAPQPIVRTVISFDRGGSWEFLAPPKVDSVGHPIPCNKDSHPGGAGPHCSLMLHGVTDVFGPFYSTSTAVGLLMATGVVGSQLLFTEGEINTYFSRDGGHEWHEVAKGSHIYEFGDHGAIIVMANDMHETSSISYSWNEGATWHSFQFSREWMILVERTAFFRFAPTACYVAETKILVDNIIIEPKGASEHFILYGTRVDTNEGPNQGSRIGVVIALDFSQLHQKQCVVSFIALLWSPMRAHTDLLDHSLPLGREFCWHRGVRL